jgi:hypothetical protein
MGLGIYIKKGYHLKAKGRIMGLGIYIKKGYHLKAKGRIMGIQNISL